MKYSEYKNILIFFYIFLCVCVCIYIYITESPCFRTEIHTTLEINYTSVKQNLKKKEQSMENCICFNSKKITKKVQNFLPK